MNHSASLRRASLFAPLTAIVMIAHQVAGKATRDAIFLSHFGVGELPKMVMAAALVSFVGVVVMSRLLTKFGPTRVIPTAFGLSGLLFIANYLLSVDYVGAAAISLYLHMSVFGAVLISGFWSVVNERFDPHSAKQTVARVAAAATLGGVLGGVLAERIATLLDARSMLLFLAAMHFICLVMVRAIGHGANDHVGPSRSKGILSDLGLLVRERYLLLMMLLMVGTAIVAALVDWAFKAVATEQFSDSESMVAFFGTFYAIVGVVTFVLQTLLGPTMLKRCGIGITLVVMPLVVFIGGFIALSFARIWSVVLLRGGENVIANSFFRSAFELLYTPLAPHQKRPSKTIIDVAADRFGDLIGGLITLAVLALIPLASVSAVITVAMGVSILLVLIVIRLHRGYINQLAVSLRDGAISLSEDEITDATTQQTFAETSVSGERAMLFERIRSAKEQRRPLLKPPNESDITTLHGQSSEETKKLCSAIDQLRSADVDTVRRFLIGDYMDDRLVPYLLPLLGEDDLAEDVRMELRWIAPRVIGTLTDSMLNPDLAVRARQRIPGVLEVTHHPRAANALLMGLQEESFNVRFSCARALARMQERDPSIVIGNEAVYAAVLKEVTQPVTKWENLDITLEIDLAEDLDARPTGSNANYGLIYVFTLLGLVHDKDAVNLSLHAVFSNDQNMRGTALEYLENVLPEEVRRGLWPHLGVPDARGSEGRRASRSSQVLISELRRLGRLT